MNNIVQGFKNINFLSKAQYDSVDKPSNNELWLIEVETYSDDDGNWYRIYPDGWCEQGSTISFSGAWTTMNLLLPFKDTSYTVLACGYRTDSSPYQSMFSVKDYKTSSFSMWASDDATSNPAQARWIAYGYIK